MLKKVSKIIASILAFLLAFFPTVSFGQVSTSSVGIFTILEKGETAPFPGTLIDFQGSSLILVEKETLEKEKRMELKFLEDSLTLKFQKEIDQLRSQLVINEKTSTSIIAIKDKQIKETEKLISKTDWTWLWVSLGVIVGVAVGIGGAALYERLR